MIVAPPRLHMIVQMVIGLSQGPGATCQRGNALAYSEINSLNKHRINKLPLMNQLTAVQKKLSP